MNFKFKFQKRKALLQIFICLSIFGCGAICASFYLQHTSLRVINYPGYQYKGYSLFYDSRFKIPFYTYEHLTTKNLKKNVDRKGYSFKENSSIYPLHRSQLKDYAHSGYDRGHMAAAAQHQNGQLELQETFLLSNACPENPNLNRGLWNHLEHQVRNELKTSFEVDVVTGPLFLAQEVQGKNYVVFEVIGEDQVAVPTHFFKVIKTKEKIKAYIIPNQDIPKNNSIENYEVTLETIEKVSGLQFKSK